MRLLIVEDHPLVAKALAGLLMSRPEFRSVSIATDSASASEQLEQSQPDVVLCDVMMDGTDVGFDLLRLHGRTTRFLMYSAFDFPAHHARALRDGAAGFVSKTADAETIFDALHAVAAGNRWFPAEVIASAEQAARPPTLRERELLELLVDGATNEELAAGLGLRVKSVESMLRRLFDRYGVDNRIQLARLAGREGWLTSRPRD